MREALFGVPERSGPIVHSEEFFAASAVILSGMSYRAREASFGKGHPATALSYRGLT